MKIIIESDECFECGKTIGIHNHHVVPRIKGGKRKIPLCEECHGKVHGKNFLNHKELTKLGLKKSKLAGTILGSPENLTHEAKLKGANRKRQIAVENENNIRATSAICLLRNQSKMSYANISEKLNIEGFLTSRNKKHTPRSVQLLWNIYNDNLNKQTCQIHTNSATIKEEFLKSKNPN